MLMELDNLKSVLIRNSNPPPLATNPRLSLRIGNVGPQESDFFFETMVIKKGSIVLNVEQHIYVFLRLQVYIVKYFIGSTCY